MATSSILLEVIVASRAKGIAPAVSLIELKGLSLAAKTHFMDNLVKVEEGLGFIIYRKATVL